MRCIAWCAGRLSLRQIRWGLLVVRAGSDIECGRNARASAAEGCRSRCSIAFAVASHIVPMTGRFPINIIYTTFSTSRRTIKVSEKERSRMDEHIKSEVARLRAQIEQEHAACVWALSGLASGTAQHFFIQRRFRQMDAAHRSLTKLIGEEEATTIVCEVFDRTPKRQ